MAQGTQEKRGTNLCARTMLEYLETHLEMLFYSISLPLLQ